MPTVSRNSESRNVGNGDGTGDGWTLLDLGDTKGLGEDWEELGEGLGEGLCTLGDSGDDWLRPGEVDENNGVLSIPSDVGARELVNTLFALNVCELERI